MVTVFPKIAHVDSIVGVTHTATMKDHCRSCYDDMFAEGLLLLLLEVAICKHR